MSATIRFNLIHLLRLRPDTAALSQSMEYARRGAGAWTPYDATAGVPVSPWQQKRNASPHQGTPTKPATAPGAGCRAHPAPAPRGLAGTRSLPAAGAPLPLLLRDASPAAFGAKPAAAAAGKDRSSPSPMQVATCPAGWSRVGGAA